jgi:hypothetical protein
MPQYAWVSGYKLYLSLQICEINEKHKTGPLLFRSKNIKYSTPGNKNVSLRYLKMYTTSIKHVEMSTGKLVGPISSNIPDFSNFKSSGTTYICRLR